MDPAKAKANYSRLCQLLVDKGGQALRRALHVIHPSSTLAAVLNANKCTLKKIRYSVLKPLQWNLLFPASGRPDSKNFDVTLLTILLRNICGLPRPAKGWDVMPPVSDTSISANIARIKIFRNEIYGHIPSAQLDDTEFEKLWQEISDPLVKLGIHQQDVDELKEAPLSPEEESYVQKLKEWKELEDELLSKLNDLEAGIQNVKNEVIELRKVVENPVPSQIDQLAKFFFNGKIDCLCRKFQEGTRKWFFAKLSIWFCSEESRVMILTAGPGVGKSVLSAKACYLYKKEGQLAACHFCDFKSSDSRNPNRILQSLASQMCQSVEGFHDKLTEGLCREHSRDSLSDAFRVLLNDPLYAVGRRKPMLIVLDALDESKTEDKSEFLELICDEFSKLPEWIKILITSRPEFQVRRKLERLNPIEILPDDYNNNLDLQHFIKHCLPSVTAGDVNSLISKCEGSFLYADCLVSELKEMDLGIEPNLSDYVPKGISGFYEKQFKRLKTGLQSCNSHTSSLVLKSFVNVIAASREPLPIKILFTCLDLSTEQYEVRETIIGIMSEILPVYDGCLTVYHKSLWDWLTLDGYDEHAFVGDVLDGTKLLLQVCKSIYSNIVSLHSVSDFQISPEKKYALKSGGKYLLHVADAQDFHWLVNVRLNFLKFKIYGNLGDDISRIIRFYKATLPDHHFWGNIHLHAFSSLIYSSTPGNIFSPYVKNRKIYYVYLQSLVDGYFDFIQNAMNCKNEARDILDTTNETWMEEIGNQYNPTFNILHHAVMGDVEDDFLKLIMGGDVVLSADNKLLAYKYERVVEVFKLPKLLMVFRLEISKSSRSSLLVFSPDSSYIIWNSLRTCVSTTKQKEIPFIPNGPENIHSCSFSCCGMKLVTSENNFIKVWDVKTKSVLVKIETEADVNVRVEYCSLGNSSSYIFVWTSDILKTFDFSDIGFLESTTLKRVDIEKISCDLPCLRNEDSYQIISPSSSQLDFVDKFRIRHYHLPTGKIVLIANKYCSSPFTWKERRCVIFLISYFSPLVVYDFVNQEVVELFDIRCLPSRSSIAWISNLDETNFLISLNDDQIFVLSFESSPQASGTYFVTIGELKSCALSPDNSFIAFCYEKGIFTIKSVDNGKTVQGEKLKKRPDACWWSELYFWVVCEGEILKYSYDSTQEKVVSSCVQEYTINYKSVLKFEEGILVIQLMDNEEILILRICDNKFYRQQIPDSSYTATSAAISSDGCAILLYRESSSDYQLWEIACENKWEICSTGKLDERVSWFCLTGTKNFRSSLWATFLITCNEDFNEPPSIYAIDFPNGKHRFCFEMPAPLMSSRIIYGDSTVIILHKDKWIYFVNVSDGKTLTSLCLVYCHKFYPHSSLSSFYIASRGILILTGPKHNKVFKIHNFENCLPY